MAIIRCENGHFFDNNKYDACPICEKEKDKLKSNIDYAMNLQEKIESAQLTQLYGQDVNYMDKTIGISFKENEQPLVTGWLVIKKGQSKGKSFPLHMGKNFIGRSLKMDVALTDEEGISRNNHFSVVYDNRNNDFYMVEGKSPAMLNGQVLKGYSKIKENDCINVADLELVFVPFCKKGRCWNE